MFEVSIFAAFLAGLIMFFLPCTLPLVPSYLSFISGTSIDHLNKGGLKNIRRKIFINSVYYVLGFSLVFILLGSALVWGGAYLSIHRDLLSKIAGVLIIFFGLFLMQETKLAEYKFFHFLYKEKRFNILRSLNPGKASSAFLFGASFSFGWTPCLGPILGTILLQASVANTAVAGIVHLVFFCLGLAMPFLLLGLAFSSALRLLPKLTKNMGVISLIGGLILIMIGILMLTGNTALWNGWFPQGYEASVIDLL